MLGNYIGNYSQNVLNINYNNKDQIMIAFVLHSIGVSAKLATLIVMFL
jgi:hypothetical protein